LINGKCSLARSIHVAGGNSEARLLLLTVTHFCGLRKLAARYSVMQCAEFKVAFFSGYFPSVFIIDYDAHKKDNLWN
jgi:hypothetical protein